MKVRPDCVKKYVLDSRKVTSMVKRLQSLHLLQVGPRQPVGAGQVSALLLIKVTEAQHIEQGKTSVLITEGKNIRSEEYS